MNAVPKNVVTLNTNNDTARCLNSEIMVLGALMIDNAIFEAVVTKGNLTAYDFSSEYNQILFKAICALQRTNTAFDPVTLADYLDLDRPKKEGWLSELGNIANNTPSSSNAASYAKVIKEASLKRQGEQVAHLMQQAIRSSNDPAQVINKAIGELTQLSATTQQKSLLHWSSGDDLAEQAKAPHFLINNILESDAHGILGGASMTYKTFAALRMMQSICTGHDFFGHEVFTADKVIYVCGEGKGALERRLKALKITNGGFNNNLIVINESIKIDNAIDMAKLRTLIDEVNPALVIFDTFASLVSDTDENSPSDVGRTLRLIKETCRNGKTSSLIIHHHGKDTTKGLRGASNFTNDVDFSFEMKREGEAMITTLSCKKMKDGEHFGEIYMKAQVVDLGISRQDGQSTTSLILTESEYTPSSRKADKPLKQDDQNVLSKIYEAINLNGIEPTTEVKQLYPDSERNTPQQIVHIDLLRPLIYPLLNVADKSKRVILKRSIDKLVQSGKVMFYNNYLWITE